MNTNNNNIISQYLQFAADVNNNISQSIQLLNHLRMSVTDIIDRNAYLVINSPPERSNVNVPFFGLGNSLSDRFGTTRRRTSRDTLRRPIRATRQTPLNRRTFGTYRRTISGNRGATNTMINSSTSTSLYSDLSSNYTICPIRQTAFDPSDNVITINYCGHVFLESALREWFRTSTECPVCRHNINPSQYRTSNNSTTENIRTALQTLLSAETALNNNTQLNQTTQTRVMDASGSTDISNNPFLFLEYSMPISFT